MMLPEAVHSFSLLYSILLYEYTTTYPFYCLIDGGDVSILVLSWGMPVRTFWFTSSGLHMYAFLWGSIIPNNLFEDFSFGGGGSLKLWT